MDYSEMKLYSKWHDKKCQYLYSLWELPSEGFGTGRGYVVTAVEMSSNLRRGEYLLDTRFGRDYEHEFPLSIYESAPVGAQRIIRQRVKGFSS